MSALMYNSFDLCLLWLILHTFMTRQMGERQFINSDCLHNLSHVANPMCLAGMSPLVYTAHHCSFEYILLEFGSHMVESQVKFFCTWTGHKAVWSGWPCVGTRGVSKEEWSSDSLPKSNGYRIKKVFSWFDILKICKNGCCCSITWSSSTERDYWLHCQAPSSKHLDIVVRQPWKEGQRSILGWQLEGNHQHWHCWGLLEVRYQCTYLHALTNE